MSGTGKELLERKEVRAAYLEGEYGLNNLFIGVPIKLGVNGVEEIIEVKLTDEEKKALAHSAGAVQTLVDDMNRLGS